MMFQGPRDRHGAAERRDQLCGVVGGERREVPGEHDNLPRFRKKDIIRTCLRLKNAQSLSGDASIDVCIAAAAVLAAPPFPLNLFANCIVLFIINFRRTSCTP